MKNVYLNIVVQTPRSLATRERVGAFCDTLRVIDPDLVPHKFGLAEPLRSIFNRDKAEDQIEDLHRLNVH